MNVDSGLLCPASAGRAIEQAVSDLACLQAMLDAETGLARAQANLGVVPAEAAKVIAAAADAKNFDLASIALRATETANPVVALVADLTEAVAATDPAAANYVHRGSTSQDVLDTGLMLVSARALDIIGGDLCRAAEALARLVIQHETTPMAGRTLTQHAVPTTFGLKAAGWLSGVLDAIERVRRVRHHGLPVQLGGAAGTLAGYLEFAAMADADPQTYATALLGAYAEELHLAEPAVPWHTIRTPLADLASALALTTGVLGKFAADVQVLTRTEIGEVSEPANPGRGASSAMPHKRNPVLATRIRAAAAQVPQLAATLHGCLVAEDERPAGAWHAEWQPLRECLRLAAGAADAAAELAAGLTVHPQRMLANLHLCGELIASERVSVALADALGKAPAREVVTSLALRAAESGQPLGELLAAHPQVAAALTSAQIAELLDPTRYVGAASTLARRALDRYDKVLPVAG